MRFRSLESRIVTLFLVSIVLLQVVGLILIQQGIARNARNAIGDDLANGTKVFTRLLEQNAQSLRFGASVLARDTGFKDAIGSGDKDTLESALVNSARRIKATMTMFVDADRKVVVSTNTQHSAALEKNVLGMLDRAEAGDGANGIAIVDGKPYQLVVMPVKAPITIGWVMLAFPIDRQLAVDMNKVSDLQVTVLTRDVKKNHWSAGGSTLAPAAVSALLQRLDSEPEVISGKFEVDLQGNVYGVQLLRVGQDDGQGTGAALARSIDEATAEYDRLMRTLLGLSILGTLLAAVASVITAKRIAQPLSQLAETAKRMEQGDYKGQLALDRDDQIGALALAFSGMRDGIAKREQEISRLAYEDTLTKLPNRARFTLLLTAAIEDAKKHDHAVYILMMDLDRFKHVNDVMGHSFGDALLRLVAERLKLQLSGDQQASAQVARLGGDEFVVLLPGVDNEQAQSIAAGILRALETPLSLDDQMVDIGAGLGIAGYPEHGQDSESLLSMVEVAMYAAKQRNYGAVVYDAALDKSSAKSLSLLTELRSAIERDEFRLHVQPKIHLATGKVVGFESLVRWVHPERGNVFPDEFIPFAEQTGFIRQLTRWVLEKSAELCRELEAHDVHLKVSVNLSTRDLLDQDLPLKFADMLARHQLAPGSFCLEITESAIMDDPVRAQQTLERLHAMGVDLSIDDFGTGYSSLAYLKKLPVNELKIDKSFVLNMENDKGDRNIVHSTIALAKSMNLRVVAEGIESEAVWRLLTDLKCDQGQGYFMSRPIPANQLLGWLGTWQAPIALVPAAPTRGLTPGQTPVL